MNFDVGGADLVSQIVPDCLSKQLGYSPVAETI